MAYEQKDFSHLVGINGLSDELLKNHFALYEGYVKNSNKLEEELVNLWKEGKTDTLQYGELKRRGAWELNGIKLHEYYFENLTKESKAIEPNSKLATKINDYFGSFDEWANLFKATALIRGIGWAVLYYDQQFDHLYNMWINEHDTGHLAGAIPILVMDVFEHAFMLDYGTKRADYLEAAMKNIDWEVVSARFDKAKL